MLQEYFINWVPIIKKLPYLSFCSTIVSNVHQTQILHLFLHKNQNNWLNHLNDDIYLLSVLFLFHPNEGSKELELFETYFNKNTLSSITIPFLSLS